MEENRTYNRREFLKTGSLLMGGLLISFSVSSRIQNTRSLASPAEFFAPNAFLRIGTDDSIHIFLSKVEMGQGIWTTLPILIAEELDCDWNKIKVEHGLIHKDYHHTLLGFQGTVGSSSTWSEFDRYRLAGATARVMLMEAAAKELGVSVQTCKTENGYVIAGKKRLRYGQVATLAAKLPIPSVALREPKDWK